MRTFFLSLLGAFTAIVLFILLSFLILAGIISAATSAEAPASNVVLEMDLRAEMYDQSPQGGLGALFEETGFIDIMSRIKAAETDDNVDGLLIRASEFSFGSARAEELRRAIIDFREAGKYVIAHSQGSYSTNPSGLRALTAADQVWMQPGTEIMVAGVSIETLFMKDLLDNLDVEAEIIALYEYKNAPNTFQQSDYTDPHREAVLSVAQSIWGISLEDMSGDRQIAYNTLTNYLQAGPMTAEKAIEYGIVDELGYPEDAVEAARNFQGNSDKTFIGINQYKPPFAGLDAIKIAVVGGEGAIVTGEGSDSPFSSDPSFASDPIARAIRKAGNNDDIDAIVFRVESGGGSPTASDQIWQAIEDVQEKGKIVVVSMGSVAASGGYYVSAGADYIFANATTITGSIGIFGGKLTISGLMERYGINPREVSVGGNFVDAFGSDPFTEDQTVLLRASLERGYERFLNIVGEGRNMSFDEVHEAARGRIWSGQDALEQDLIDEIGGFNEAVDKALELSGAPEGATPRLIYYPMRKTGFEAFEDLFGVSAEMGRAASAISYLAGDERLQAIIGQTHSLNTQRVQMSAPTMREK